MSSSDTLYQIRARGPEALERGRDQVLRVQVRRSGALVAPSSATCTLVDAAGASVTLGSVTIVDSIAQCTLAGSTTTAMLLGNGWLLRWLLTMSDGQVLEQRITAALVRTRLHPPCTEADLYERMSSLDPSGTSPISSRTDYTSEGETSWRDIEQRLFNEGKRPWLVMDSSAFFAAHRALWIAHILDDFATRLNPAFLELAKQWHGRYRDCWPTNIAYDENDDGQHATTEKAAGSSVWLM